MKRMVRAIVMTGIGFGCMFGGCSFFEMARDGIDCRFTDGTFTCDGGFDFEIPNFGDD